MKVLVKGAGVAGLTVAHELALRQVAVTVVDKRQGMQETASWFAGGMLAPYCERESAEEIVLELGLGASDWWEKVLPGSVTRNGTLVVSAARDVGELDRFAGRTTGFARLDRNELAELEPDLAGRFRRALYFEKEAHLDPRRVLPRIKRKLMGLGVAFRQPSEIAESGFDVIADCTGAARIGVDPNLRGVRGEMLLLRAPDVMLSRPVRLLHPRFPLYVVPRGGHLMLGATMIETDAAGPITARSVMELLNAAYSLDPAFGEAEIIETGVGIRPAYPDNLPRVERSGATITVNGLYRHGFLLAPAMAQRAADMICGRKPTRELVHEAHH
ncbi:glycine oxidase ThiO [Mesorhizobium sp.]|uniref:glycine oxidase ThiO n=1 Tax=Mesorhizobium sp. TaxID=1871066 RepID=UPI000FE88FD4|nr:glycine oxidase ThiO [Mesorhizobium sp.]RWJ31920.1 MAG: glycine oxidase ThiO [Mesorhizobium sp.]TIQ73873.1 MAG: glycine oxidase ThiO [Mesorhizobium sp.]